MRTNKEKLYSLGALLLILASIAVFYVACSENESKQKREKETKYLYRMRYGDNYLGGFHEDRECTAIKTVLRKNPEITVGRFQKEEITTDLDFCSCVSDKTYDEVMKAIYGD